MLTTFLIGFFTGLVVSGWQEVADYYDWPTGEMAFRGDLSGLVVGVFFAIPSGGTGGGELEGGRQGRPAARAGLTPACANGTTISQRIQGALPCIAGCLWPRNPTPCPHAMSQALHNVHASRCMPLPVTSPRAFRATLPAAPATHPPLCPHPCMSRVRVPAGAGVALCTTQGGGTSLVGVAIAASLMVPVVNGGLTLGYAVAGAHTAGEPAAPGAHTRTHAACRRHAVTYSLGSRGWLQVGNTAAWQRGASIGWRVGHRRFAPPCRPVGSPHPS